MQKRTSRIWRDIAQGCSINNFYRFGFKFLQDFIFMIEKILRRIHIR